MNELLEFITRNCSFLYEEYNFRITHSEYSNALGGSGTIIFEGNNLQIQFVREYRKIYAEFKFLLDKKNDSWYPIDIINTLITGDDGSGSIMNEANILFLRKNLPTIINCFNTENIDNTLSSVPIVIERRLKRMFPSASPQLFDNEQSKIGKEK